MKNLINKFLLDSYKLKEIKLIDIYFSKLFDNENKFSGIFMLFGSILSLSSRLGCVCLPINKIFNGNIFTDYILKFLFFFFSNYFNINECINLMIKFNILSFWYKKECTPFIIYNECIYLYKFWYYENYIIDKIFLKNKICNNKISNKVLKYKKFIKKLDLNFLSIKIINSIFFNKITIISGSPGTGKSTLIVKLIIFLYKIFNFKSNKDISIISFTGKLSSLLTLFLKKYYIDFKLNNKFKSKLPIKCYTIHKFLGFNYINNFIKYNKNNKKYINILILDESSMIDISMMFNIISSLYSFTKLIFIGDHNQISSIEPGSFFNEICKYVNDNKYNINLFQSYFKYNKNIFFLKKNYRFNKNINYFLILIKDNNLNLIEKIINENNFSSNIIFYDSEKISFSYILNLCINKYMKYINYINNNSYEYLNILKIFNRFKIICIVRETFLGVLNINLCINKFLIENKLVKHIRFFLKHNCIHFLGEPIIINKNNNDFKLFNGDLGFFVLNKRKKLRLYFYNYKYKLHPLLLFNWENSWSITVHKSQGSEFNTILLFLPNFLNNLVNKQLIYTALSRAKNKIIIYGNKNIFLKSLVQENISYNNIIKKII